MDAVFPLIKKYGGVVVGLTLDEDGIPADSRRACEGCRQRSSTEAAEIWYR